MIDVRTQELGFLAKVVIGLAIVLFVAGVAQHGVIAPPFNASGMTSSSDQRSQ